MRMSGHERLDERRRPATSRCLDGRGRTRRGHARLEEGRRAPATTNRVAEVAGVSIGSVYQVSRRARHLRGPSRASRRADGGHRREHAGRARGLLLAEQLVRAMIDATVHAHAKDVELHELLWSGGRTAPGARDLEGPARMPRGASRSHRGSRRAATLTVWCSSWPRWSRRWPTRLSRVRPGCRSPPRRRRRSVPFSATPAVNGIDPRRHPALWLGSRRGEGLGLLRAPASLPSARDRRESVREPRLRVVEGERHLVELEAPVRRACRGSARAASSISPRLIGSKPCARPSGSARSWSIVSMPQMVVATGRLIA